MTVVLSVAKDLIARSFKTLPRQAAMRSFASLRMTDALKSWQPASERRSAMDKQYDRSAEDLGNIIGLEHVNLQVEDQGVALGAG